MKKLWKAIFYCVWHSDKSLVQSQLINELSSLLLSLHLPLAVHYFSAFLLTIRREWTGLDGLRLDKFYLMIRRFLHCFFQLLKVNDWDLELITRLMTIVEEKAFFPKDIGSQNNGFDYHVASVFLEEFKVFLPFAGSEATLDAILKPFFSVMSKSKDKVLVNKVKSSVFDLLLKTGKSLMEGKIKQEDVDVETVNLGSIALVMKFSAKFYDLGSFSDTYQGNRKVCFDLHKQFMKLEKDLEYSGVEISLPLSRANDDEEKVPDLIPLLSNESSKKKKKKDKAVIMACSDKSKSSEKENENPVVTFNESVISNLQMQFEKVAAEVGLIGTSILNSGEEDEDDVETPKVAKVSKKKRKRSKNSSKQEVTKENSNGEANGNGNTSGKSGKRVRFSIKDNMVWKPQSPLPPQNLRIPPSVTPRGSALKKGIPAGPIRQVAAVTLKKKKKKKVQKAGGGGANRVWKM